MMVHDKINTSEDCAFRNFALRTFSGDISTNDQVINVALCPTDALPLPSRHRPTVIIQML